MHFQEIISMDGALPHNAEHFLTVNPTWQTDGRDITDDSSAGDSKSRPQQSVSSQPTSALDVLDMAPTDNSCLPVQLVARKYRSNEQYACFTYVFGDNVETARRKTNPVPRHPSCSLEGRNPHFRAVGGEVWTLKSSEEETIQSAGYK